MFANKKLIILIFLSMLLIAGCNSTPDKIDIKGKITEVLVNDDKTGYILVEGAKTDSTSYDKARVSFDKDTKITGGKITDLQLSTNVEVVFTGPVAESYPVQAKAKIISILGSDSIEEPIAKESNQVGDFEVAIKWEKNGIVAAITYLGKEDKIDIYHGGSIFFFNIYQVDGDFEYIGAMDLPLLTTTLTRNVPHKVPFIEMALEPGTYEYEAITAFSLDKNDIVGSQIKIPVSKIIKID